MPRLQKTESDNIDKFQRYRKARRDRGLKLLRMWVRDPHAPEFAKEAERQGRLLRGRAEELEALEFIAAAFAWPAP